MKNKLNNFKSFLKQYFSKIVNIYSEHIFLYSILLAILTFFIIVLFALILKNTNSSFVDIINILDTDGNIISQNIFVMGIMLNNWSSLAYFIILPIGGIWVLHQFTKNIKFNQQDKGANIAEKFAKEVIDEIGVINNVLKAYPDINNIIKKVVRFSKLNFNKYEMEKIFTPEEIIKFEEFIKSKKANKIYKYIIKKIYNNKNFPNNFHSLVLDTLNNLEAICMDISSSAAGSDFIYPSLHAPFNKLVQMLYIQISSSNTDNLDFSFINIRFVYNSWFKLRNKDHKKLIKTTKKIDKIYQKADEEVQKLLDKTPKTV